MRAICRQLYGRSAEDGMAIAASVRRRLPVPEAELLDIAGLGGEDTNLRYSALIGS
jgi:hypothetical protein